MNNIFSETFRAGLNGLSSVKKPLEKVMLKLLEKDHRAIPRFTCLVFYASCSLYQAQGLRCPTLIISMIFVAISHNPTSNWGVKGWFALFCSGVPGYLQMSIECCWLLNVNSNNHFPVLTDVHNEITASRSGVIAILID